eukprot:scaffold125051_cov35-Prasinocladus_malaysianus.AAC.1
MRLTSFIGTRNRTAKPSATCALSSLRKIFADCLDRNSRAPELEQLTRQEFIIDRDMYLKLQAKGVEK